MAESSAQRIHNKAVIVEGSLQNEMGCIDVLAKRIWPFDTNGAVDGVRARSFH